MKTIIVTESLNQGGAERQTVELAILFRKFNVEVTVLTYTKGDFYKNRLLANKIDLIELKWAPKITLLLSFCDILNKIKPDVVWCVLPSTANYFEILKAFYRKLVLIVSERSAMNNISKIAKLKKYLHCFADCIVTNTHANRLQLIKNIPLLESKTVTVYNIVKLHKYNEINRNNNSVPIIFVIMARYNKVKNLYNVINSCANSYSGFLTDKKFEMHWYGQIQDQKYFDNAKRLIVEKNLTDIIYLHTETNDPAAIYKKSDALIMASFYEGLPNSVCEALTFGLPILASNVSDISNLVHDCENGFVFDPLNIESITHAINRFIKLSIEERMMFSKKSLSIANDLFNRKLIDQKYLEILYLTKGKRKIDNFPKYVPESAINFLNRTFK